MLLCEKGFVQMIDRIVKGGYVLAKPWSEMFPEDSGTKQETRFIRSGRRFSSDKTQKNLFRQGICNTQREEEGYEFSSYLDEGSCD